MDLATPILQDELEAWQFYYNWQRVHGSLNNTPMERCCELFAQTPLSEEVYDHFDENQEREYHRNRLVRTYLKSEMMSMNRTQYIYSQRLNAQDLKRCFPNHE